MQEAAGGGSDEDAFVRLVVSQLHDVGFAFDEHCLRQNLHDDWSFVERDIEWTAEFVPSYIGDARDVVASQYADKFAFGIGLSC